MNSEKCDGKDLAFCSSMHLVQVSIPSSVQRQNDHYNYYDVVWKVHGASKYESLHVHPVKKNMIIFTDLFCILRTENHAQHTMDAQK